MRLVILESPYAGDVEKNVEYARRCVRDSLMRGEAPIASHLLYTQEGILDDDVPEERKKGIAAGLAWRKVAAASVVYTDLGITEGMEFGISKADSDGLEVEYRTINTEILAPTEPKKLTKSDVDGLYKILGDTLGNLSG